MGRASKLSNHKADLIVVIADAAVFRSRVLTRNRYSTERLDKMNWTMAPFTVYLGLNRKVPHIDHHNYLLRNNFKEYSNKLYRNEVNLDQPYYNVNVVSRHNSNAVPEGGEALYILVPVPDRRSRLSNKDEQFHNLFYQALQPFPAPEFQWPSSVPVL